MKRFFNPLTLLLIAILAADSLLERSHGSFGDWLMDELMMLPAILIGFSFHEFGHAFVADKLGDVTPRAQGRVTLNPFAHMDPVGFCCLLFIGFGWGVPVEINPYNFKHRRRDEFLVAIAGVFLNFLLAVAFMGILRLLYTFAPEFIGFTKLGSITFELLKNCVMINIVLMVFNLIPVPPLDGFGIITQVFNLTRYEWWYKLYRNGFLILMLLILFGITDRILNPAIVGVWNFLVMIFF